MQLVGLKSCHAGNPLPKGVKDTGAEALLKHLQRSPNLIKEVLPSTSRIRRVTNSTVKEKPTPSSLCETLPPEAKK